MGWIVFLVCVGGLAWLIYSIGFGCFAVAVLYTCGIVRLAGVIYERRSKKRDKQDEEEMREEFDAFLECEKKRFKNRVDELMQKYGDEEIVRNIVNKKYWQGQTAEQLLDSIGEPLDIDPEVIKDKRREIWKYNKQGKGRYGFRVILEDGLVVGWRGVQKLKNNDEEY